MADQIVLAWDVSIRDTTFGLIQASAALTAVQLYTNPLTDPVLGQFFGLTVAADVVTQPDASTVRRTLTLNMSAVSLAPPPFPCHPNTRTPPAPPYTLRRTVTLPGSFFVTNGINGVGTTLDQAASIPPNTEVQFLSQPGVTYLVASVISPTQIVLTTPYTGVTSNAGAFKTVLAPVTRAAVYSTSPLDTSTVATSPAIPAGPGAQTVIISYHDSLGGGPFSAFALLNGKRPVEVVLAGGSIDISQIDAMFVLAAGSFGNSVGQITLCELSEALPPILANRTPADFAALTDEAQLLISGALAYLPPSFFALAQQGNATPMLEGDFIVTTGSKAVPTTEDQTGTLAAGHVIELAAQPGTLYTVAAVTPKIVTLTGPFTGIDTGYRGDASGVGTRDMETKGNVGDEVIKRPSGAQLRVPSPSIPPTNDELAAVLGQFTETQVAMPPPDINPATVPTPTFLSGLFTQTLQLALAGIVITPQPITFV